jgi:hypothetical protein
MRYYASRVQLTFYQEKSSEMSKKWFRTKRKEARRLEIQLADHFPRGRDIQSKTVLNFLETTNRNDFTNDLEYLLWHNPIYRNPPSLPHPIEFNTNTDLRWFKLDRKQYKDVITGKTIACRSTRQLLGAKYPKLSEYRLKQQSSPETEPTRTDYQVFEIVGVATTGDIF